MDEVVDTCNTNLQEGINLARNAPNKDLQNTWGAATDLETSDASVANSASAPVWGQPHLILFVSKEQLLPTILGLHLQILLSSTTVRLGEDVRIKHDVPFLWVSERRLCIYFPVFVPTGFKYISPESHPGASTGAFNSEAKHPSMEGPWVATEAESLIWVCIIYNNSSFTFLMNWNFSSASKLTFRHLSIQKLSWLPGWLI